MILEQQITLLTKENLNLVFLILHILLTASSTASLLQKELV